VQIGGVRLARIDLWPGGPRDFADINVAMPVDGETVRCEELAELGAGLTRNLPSGEYLWTRELPQPSET
jgi:hypothetical protein